MQRRVLTSVLVVLACALIAGIAGAQPVPTAPTGEKFIDLSGIGGTESALGEKKEDTVEQAKQDAGTGDNKEYKVPVDEDIDITKVKAGDIYGAGEKTLFTVTAVEPAGTRGGTITFVRTHGRADPDRQFNLVQGGGPPKIIKRIRLIDYYWAAGWPAHFISALAVAAIIMSANSIWLYRAGRQCPARFVVDARTRLAKGDLDGMDDLAQRQTGLFPALCRALTDRFDTSTVEDIRNRLEITAGAYISRLRVPVKALNFCAVCAPLIGLAGTIYGMIIVFEGVAGSTGAGRAAVLAAGIRLKLLCTLFALMVAIPSLALFFYFNARLSTIIARCEILAEEFLHMVLVLKRGKAEGNGKAETAGVGASEPALSR